jgi:iron complex transport system substrate-binding protein
MRLVWAALAALWLGLAGPAFAANVIDDATGRHVELPDKIARILPAGPPASVLLFTLAPEKMIGWTHKPGPAAQPFLGDAAALPEIGPIAPHGEPDLDRIRAAKPDLILDFGTVSPRYIEQAKKIQEASGIPCILIDGRLDKTPETYRLLGKLLGVEARGNELAAAAEKILAAPHPAIEKTAYYGRGADGLATGRGSSMSGEVLKALRLKNVAGEEGDPGSLKVTKEQLEAWNPQVILVGEADAAASLKTDTALTGKIYAVSAPPFGWLDEPPSVNRLAGVIWGSHVLDGTPGDAAADLRGFYRQFYRATLADDQIADLLK